MKSEPKITIDAANATKLLNWIQNRGGVAVWRSYIDLSTTWNTPDDKLTRPSVMSYDKPERIVTSAEDIQVVEYKEVQRFRVAVRKSGNGLSLKCTNASSNKIRKALEKHGNESAYEFDFYTQEAVILVPEKTTSLSEFKG